MERLEAIPEQVTGKSLIEQQIEMLKILLDRNAITIDAYNKGMQYLTQQNGKKNSDEGIDPGYNKK